MIKQTNKKTAVLKAKEDVVGDNFIFSGSLFHRFWGCHKKKLNHLMFLNYS